MAKSKRTTARGKPASAVGPAKRDREIDLDLVRGGREKAQDQQYNIGHLADMLKGTGEEIGKPNAVRDTIEWQRLGLRVEYIADLLAYHVHSLANALDTLGIAEDRLSRGAK